MVPKGDIWMHADAIGHRQGPNLRQKMITISAARRAAAAQKRSIARPSLPENGINNLERDTTVQCFAMNASTVSLNAWGFSNSSP
jgi:hypothetical protein